MCNIAPSVFSNVQQQNFHNQLLSWNLYFYHYNKLHAKMKNVIFLYQTWKRVLDSVKL